MSLSDARHHDEAISAEQTAGRATIREGLMGEEAEEKTNPPLPF